MSQENSELKRMRISVSGTVQGVGFRPFVFRLAEQFALKGFVLNAGGAVVIEVEGHQQYVQNFLTGLTCEAPPLAKITSSSAELLEPRFDEERFLILESDRTFDCEKSVPPDCATCQDCFRELFDPSDRRYLYPFINCTNCGPRFTIIESFPYDRQRTTMSTFQMCGNCADEYSNPADRRFHAQPNACSLCGPQLQFVTAHNVVSNCTDGALRETVALLRRGGVAAIKGLGGFHLCCDATSDDAVRLLRRRKHRDEKPLAVMYRSIEDIESDCVVPGAAQSALCSHQRPIVLCNRNATCTLSEQISPGLDRIGVMLPYTPLHYVLMELYGGPLVMTSGNVSDEPICIDNQEAIERLSPLCDGLLLHNRAIAARYDDSVVLADGAEQIYPVRRSRGYAPEPIVLDSAFGSVLAFGAHLKNTFCILSGTNAYVSQHIGDLDNLDSLSHFEESLERFLHLFDLKPDLIACDMHPDYMSTSLADDWAQKLQLPLVAVQHHHAHIAACAAEHHVEGPVLGIAFDGLGYGTDGSLWGGEFLVCDRASFLRVAHLKAVPVIGGNVAMREPWRMALSYLRCHSELEWFASSLAGQIDNKRVSSLLKLLVTLDQTDPLFNVTSSCGRLFDAVAAVAGIRYNASYEGQAAMELEAAARRGQTCGSQSLIDTSFSLDSVVVETSQLVVNAATQRMRGVSPDLVALNFHLALSNIVVQKAHYLCRNFNLSTVCLGGGCFQNLLLLNLIRDGLREHGLRVLVPQKLPCNDGGIAFGQAVVAAAKR